MRLPADQEVYRLQGQLCVLDSYSPIEESGSNKGPEQQQSLYDVRENQERALSRPLRTFLMTSYITDIEKKLLESLRRMHQHGLTPKLEGRWAVLITIFHTINTHLKKIDLVSCAGEKFPVKYNLEMKCILQKNFQSRHLRARPATSTQGDYNY